MKTRKTLLLPIVLAFTFAISPLTASAYRFRGPTDPTPIQPSGDQLPGSFILALDIVTTYFLG
jgi:hypothetical protein